MFNKDNAWLLLPIGAFFLFLLFIFLDAKTEHPYPIWGGGEVIGLYDGVDSVGPHGNNYIWKVETRDYKGWKEWTYIPRELYLNLIYGDTLSFYPKHICITRWDLKRNKVVQIEKNYDELD